MEPPADWPFDDPPNVAVITTRAILDGDDWIALVTHDEDDGAWQFHGSAPSREEDAAVVALRRVVGLDCTVAALADLPLGWRASRAAPSEPWQRSHR